MKSIGIPALYKFDYNYYCFVNTVYFLVDMIHLYLNNNQTKSQRKPLKITAVC